VKKGLEEGVKKGMKDVARKMKDAGVDIQQITAFTSLPVQEIEK
jgi:predicted transposase/invertase (TIGR01784 family)